MLLTGRTVITGRAVQFRVSGGTAETTYTISIQVGTDSTPSQTVHGDVILDLGAD